MFVALYRFYSHVKVVDDAYVCDLTNAQEIHKYKLANSNIDIRQNK